MTSLLETYTLHILNAMRKFGIEMKEKGLHVCDKSEREIVFTIIWLVSILFWRQFSFIKKIWSVLFSEIFIQK